MKRKSKSRAASPIRKRAKSRAKRPRAQKASSGPMPEISTTAVSLAAPVSESGVGNPLLFFGFVAAGYLLLRMDWPVTGFACLLLATLTALRIRSASNPTHQFLMAVSGIAGFLLLLYGLMGLPGLAMSLPPPVPCKPSKPVADIFLGFMLVLGGFAWGRSDANRPGLGWFSSKLWLWLILAAAAWIRLSHYGDPPSLYWMDYAMSMVDARSALDFPEERYFIFPHGSRQPFYQYLATLAYYFFPDSPAYILQNVLWGLIDLVAVWIHYLLGKEVGGRRVGLVLAALMALSKPVLVNSMTGQSPVTGPLGIGLILLFTFRFLRKTDAAHAFQWGAAVALGAYCYTPVRMYMWIAPITMLAVAFWKSRNSPLKNLLGTLAAGLALVWTYLYFTTNQFIKPVAQTLRLPGGDLIPNLFLLVLAILALQAWKNSSSDPGARSLSRVVLGVVVAGALAAPIATHPLFSEWSFRWSIFWPNHPLLPPEGLTWKFVLSQFQNSFSTIFKTMMDRGDMSLPGEAFFNLQSEALVLAGLAYAVCRTSWRSTFLIACAVICTIPHAFSFMGHTGRLIGVVSPLFLLAAIATDAFLGNLRRFRGGLLWTTLAVVGLAWLGLWAYQTADYRFYNLLPRHAGNNVTIFNQARKDVAKYRVYLIQEGTMAAFYDLTPLVDNTLDLYAMGFPKGSAPVPVPPGGKAPDVAIYVSNNYPEIRARIRDEFPNVRFEDLHSCYEPPGTTQAFMYRAYIPGDDIQYIRQKHNPRMFYKVDVPERAWRRRFYFHHYGLGKGVIQAEDWVTDPESSLPIENAVRPVEITGTIRLPKDGKYRFSVESWNFAVVNVGKHLALNLRGVGGKPLTDSRVLFLKAGEYPVRFKTYFQAGFAVPPVKVLVPGESEERPLGSLGS